MQLISSGPVFSSAKREQLPSPDQTWILLNNHVVKTPPQNHAGWKVQCATERFYERLVQLVHAVKIPSALSHCKNRVNADRPYGFTEVSHLLVLHSGCTYRAYIPVPYCKNEIISSFKTCTEFFVLSHTALQAEKEIFQQIFQDSVSFQLTNTSL